MKPIKRCEPNLVLLPSKRRPSGIAPCLVFAFALTVCAGPGGGGSPAGGYGAPCYPNGTCNGGFECLRGLCVPGEDASVDGDAASVDDTGQAGINDAQAGEENGPLTQCILNYDSLNDSLKDFGEGCISGNECAFGECLLPGTPGNITNSIFGFCTRGCDCENDAASQLPDDLKEELDCLYPAGFRDLHHVVVECRDVAECKALDLRWSECRIADSGNARKVCHATATATDPPAARDYTAVIVDDSRIFPTHRVAGTTDPCATASPPLNAHGADIDAIGLFDNGLLVGYLDVVDYQEGGVCTGSRPTGPTDPDQAKGAPNASLTERFVSLGGGFLIGEFSGQPQIQSGDSIVVYEVGTTCGSNQNCGGVDEGYEVFVAFDLDCVNETNYPYASCGIRLSDDAAGESTIPVTGF